MKNRYYSSAVQIVVVVFLSIQIVSGQGNYNSLKLISVQKIWDKAPHSAFTDIIWHNGRFFWVFREGSSHVSPDGAWRVITSVDGEKWELAALITSENSDLRDAKITVTPSGKLMLSGAEAYSSHEEKTAIYLAKVAFENQP